MGKDLSDFIVEAGLAGASESELLRGFCTRLVAAGVPLQRSSVIIDTLHPLYEGRIFAWDASQSDTTQVREYGPTPTESWRRSVFYHLLQTGGSFFRRNLARGRASRPMEQRLSGSLCVPAGGTNAPGPAARSGNGQGTPLEGNGPRRPAMRTAR